jgi:DNA ligase 1
MTATKTLPLLYSRTSKGQVQTWQITIDGGTFFTEEGIKGGAISKSKPTVCKSKNVGRANETTPEQQAESEAQSKWQHKKDRGYWENEADIDNVTVFWPMLAQKWKDYKDEIDWTKLFFCQPKLDGMRCVVRKEGMFSREGKPINSAPHIRKLLQPLFDKNPDFIFDGELYNHDLKHNFDKLMSLAKKQKPTPEQLIESEKKLQYWMYDFYDPANPDRLFDERFVEALKMVKSLGPVARGKIRWTYTNAVKSEAEMDELFVKYVDHGFEGGMGRMNEPYQVDKRTKFLLKRKDFIDEEFILFDLEDGDGNRAGLATSAFFKDPNGSIIHKGEKCWKAGVIGGNEYTRDLLKNKANVIGKKATVCYFNLTPAGVPRFGKMKIIRDYE